jgi:hypothetical protein
VRFVKLEGCGNDYVFVDVGLVPGHEAPPDDPASLAVRVSERRYGIGVSIGDVPHPFTGDLDGERIQVDHEQTPEEALFVLVHLFGHTVQWNVNPRYREIGAMGVLLRPDEALLAELLEYERQACRYSLQLFHEAGIDELDAWLADFAACDLAYLEHVYRTGEKRDFRSFFRPGQPRVEPLAIPEFHPTRWVTRWGGVVI